jgi:hypothetical protein
VTDDSGRDQRGRFAQGNAGGPGGPRRRASELRKAAEDAITPEHVQAMIRKATRMGLEGNLAAMRLVFERTSGRAPEAPAETEPLSIALPRLRTAADCNLALERLVDGICKGAIERESARLLIDAVQARLKAIEVQDLEARLAEMERTAKAMQNGTFAQTPDERFL